MKPRKGLNAILQRLDHLATRFQGEVGSAHDVERAIGQVANSVVEALGRIRGEQEAAGREMDAFNERGHGLSLRLEGLRTAAISGVSDIAAEADRLQQRSESLTDELKGQTIAFGDTINRADGIASMVKSTAEMIDQTIAAAGDASRTIRGEFHTLGHEMQSRSGQIQQEAVQAAETLAQAKARMEDSLAQIGAILANLDGKAGDINFTVSSSISRLNEMTHGLERARAEVLGTSDKAAEHIGTATSNLYASVDRIREAADHVSGVTHHAAEVGNQLAGNGNALRDRVAEITQSVYEASDKLQSTTNDLSNSANYTREQLGNIAREVRHENEAIANTLGRIASVETALRNAGSMVDDIVANAEKATAAAREEMHSVGREIALQSKVLAETSGSNGVILTQARDELEGVVGRVQDAFGSLNQKAGEINFAVSTAVNRLGELSRGIGRRTGKYRWRGQRRVRQNGADGIVAADRIRQRARNCRPCAGTAGPHIGRNRIDLGECGFRSADHRTETGHQLPRRRKRQRHVCRKDRRRVATDRTRRTILRRQPGAPG